MIDRKTIYIIESVDSTVDTMTQKTYKQKRYDSIQTNLLDGMYRGPCYYWNSIRRNIDINNMDEIESFSSNIELD